MPAPTPATAPAGAPAAAADPERSPASPPTLALDHLVVAAATLAQGVQWCEAVLGITPGPGGTHALMGTHNRLFAIGDDRAYPLLYAEIIAIDPAAPPPPHARWFGLDALQPRLLAEGPRLVHAVVRSTALAQHRQALVDAGHAPGEALALARGDYRWRMLLRRDGAVPATGAVPTLLQWDGPHPARSMPPSGVTLSSLTLRGVDARVRDVLALPGVGFAEGDAGAALRARLATPRGPVTLESPT